MLVYLVYLSRRRPLFVFPFFLQQCPLLFDVISCDSTIVTRAISSLVNALVLTSLASGHIGLRAHDIVPHAISWIDRDANLVRI